MSNKSYFIIILLLVFCSTSCDKKLDGSFKIGEKLKKSTLNKATKILFHRKYLILSIPFYSEEKDIYEGYLFFYNKNLELEAKVETFGNGVNLSEDTLYVGLSYFDRNKNFAYPNLPKGIVITEFNSPSGAISIHNKIITKITLDKNTEQTRIKVGQSDSSSYLYNNLKLPISDSIIDNEFSKSSTLVDNLSDLYLDFENNELSSETHPYSGMSSFDNMLFKSQNIKIEFYNSIWKNIKYWSTR